jgi:magnesium chelatase family protein
MSKLAVVSSATVLGVEGRAVRVEVHVGPGLPGFTIVGLPDAACREARDRVRAAIATSGLSWPMQRITVNLAPSSLRKIGGGLDVAIAVGVLVADDKVSAEAVRGTGFVGELGLDGSVRPVAGTVPLVDALDTDAVVVPRDSAEEALLVDRHVVRPVATLAELVTALNGEEPWPDHPRAPAPPAPPVVADLADVRGQPVARHALELAAAGGHNLLFVGPPGAGKTMLAQRLPGILPPLTPEDALLTTRVHSAAGLIRPGTGLVTGPPFRAPHHSSSMVSLVGGGTASMRPGELSLAAGGVLFLDELGEFQPSALDALRQPIEEGCVRVSRARASVTLPARFLLVAAMNPCPCGQGGPGECMCTDAARLRYRRRLSAPLLDRFDLRVDVTRPDVEELLRGHGGERSATVRERVVAARERAAARGVTCNARLPADRLEAEAPLTPGALTMIETSLRQGRLSARGLARVRRVALTVADLAGLDGPLRAEEIGQALALRSDPLPLDRAIA